MTDPAIQDTVVDLERRAKTCDTMVAIKDSMHAVIKHEDGRGRDTSALQAELMELEETLTALRESAVWTRKAEQVAANQPVYDALGTWMEANRREGCCASPPIEIRNILQRKMVEGVEPSSIRNGCVHGNKGPSVVCDQWS